MKKCIPIFATIVLLSALLISVPVVTAADTHVSPDDDIQAAIDAANPGDTIVFALGTYYLSNTLNVNKPLTLTSAVPLDSTKPVLDGGGTLDRIIYIDAENVTIDGLEVTNGAGDLIRQSNAHSGTTIRNSIIHGSTGDEGIQLKACTDCLVECNLVYDIAQDGISIADGSNNSIISNNEIYNVGSENAAIYIYDSSSMSVICNYIHDTWAANGIGFYKNYEGTHTIANNLIVHNEWLGGKHCYDEADGNSIWIYKPRVASTYVISHNTLDDNMPGNPCAQPGHVVYVNDGYGSGFVANVDDNIISNHSGYGIRVFYGANVNYSYNDLWNNALGATDSSPIDMGGNIMSNPLFNLNYTLGAGSPCIDAASDGEDMGRLFDQCGCEVANTPPVCTDANPSIESIWPPNHQFEPVYILGVSDPDGDEVTISINAIFQDEPVDSTGDGSFVPDGIIDGSMAQVRAERDGSGNGRVYYIYFTADDGNGGTCTGEVKVSVPKSQGKNGAAVGEGPLYDSTIE